MGRKGLLVEVVEVVPGPANISVGESEEGRENSWVPASMEETMLYRWGDSHQC